jgi:hypothetical protein
LADVSVWARKAFRSKNQIILGDFNAGGTYVSGDGGGDFDRVRLRSDRKFHWLIPDHMDTTATNTLAAYDRIVAFGDMKQRVDPSSAMAWRYDEDPDFNVDSDLLLRVSDHYPVEVDLLPAVHPAVRENISVRKAVVIRDSRKLQIQDVDFRSRDFELQIFYSKNGGIENAKVTGDFGTARELSAATTALRETCPDLVSYSVLSVLKDEADKVQTKGTFHLLIDYNAKTGTISITMEY